MFLFFLELKNKELKEEKYNNNNNDNNNIEYLCYNSGITYIPMYNKINNDIIFNCFII